jgi:hypothetical protein
MKRQMRGSLILFISVAVLLTGCGAVIAGDDHPCPVTTQPEPAFIPPPYYEGQAPFEGAFWFGGDGLWTMLRDEAWSDLPLSQDGYVQKLFWWADGYVWDEEPNPVFLLRGERLDGKAAMIESEEATNAFSEYGSSILTSAAIPTEGCWQFSGSYQGESLSFVVEIKP